MSPSTSLRTGLRLLRQSSLAVFWLTACVTPTAPKPAATPKPPQVKPMLASEPMTPDRLPAWTHWEPVTVPILRPPAPTADEPIAVSDAIAAKLGEAATSELKQTKVGAVSAVDGSLSGSAWLKEFRAENIPYVVTFSTLVELAHRAFDVAIATAAETQWDPALRKLLVRLLERLEREQRDAKADLVPAYVTARGMAAVARALLDPKTPPPADLASVVKLEMAHITKGEAVAKSDLLQVPVDYPALAAATSNRPAAARAMAWLEHAALVLVGRGEEGHIGEASVALARTHTRAALLLARLLDPRLDSEAAAAWETIERSTYFLWGSPDDLSPRDLAALAARVGASLEDPKWITNIVLVDRLRNLARENTSPMIYDGSGTFSLDEKRSKITIAPTVRLFPTRDTPDSIVLQSLVYPFVGAQASGSQSAVARDARRIFPRVLDVLAYLGSGEARAKLRDQGDDAFEGFDAQFKQLVATRPSSRSLEWHGSVYVSMIDTIATYLGDSIADGRLGDTPHAPLRQLRLGPAGAAWVRIRVASDRFGQAQTTKELAPLSASPATSVEAFVEEQPEAIAKLLAFVRQLVRGFEGFGALPPTSPARAICNEVDDILWDALGVLTKQLNDEPLDAKSKQFLATFPERLARLEIEGVSRAEIHHAPEFGLFSFAEVQSYRPAAWTLTRQGTHEPVVALGPVNSFREVLVKAPAPPEK